MNLNMEEITELYQKSKKLVSANYNIFPTEETDVDYGLSYIELDNLIKSLKDNEYQEQEANISESLLRLIRDLYASEGKNVFNYNNSEIISLFLTHLLRYKIKRIDWSDYLEWDEIKIQSESFNRLEKYYSFINKEEVYKYLNDNYELYSVLYGAHEQIRKYFLNEILALKLLQYPGDECWEQLAIKIKTNISPKEAGKKLEQFENEWWLDNSYGINNQLLINLEFV